MYLVTMTEDSIEVEDKRQVVKDGHYVVLKRNKERAYRMASKWVNIRDVTATWPRTVECRGWWAEQVNTLRFGHTVSTAGRTMDNK